MRVLRHVVIKALATCFFLGYVPPASGSLCSLIGLGIYAGLTDFPAMYLAVSAAVITVGFVVSGRMEALVGQKDPSCIVIDEVAGMLVALSGLPVSWPVMVTAFFVFRAFDMFKIYPAKRMESVKGGVGVMADDLIAGIYTNIIMHSAIALVAFIR